MILAGAFNAMLKAGVSKVSPKQTSGLSTEIKSARCAFIGEVTVSGLPTIQSSSSHKPGSLLLLDFSMVFRTSNTSLHGSAASVWRVVHYAFHDWTREMTSERRFVTASGLLLQGYAFYALLSHSLVWPLIWPTGPALRVSACLMWMLGYWVTNVMLTSEFIRKTQLESDLIAAQQIQRTLQPETIEPVSGYHVEYYYRPFRGVGGDYFDVIDLGSNGTLFAVADVSGKGMPAALLASNIQALVRSIVDTEVDLPTLASRINRHLFRYTPRDRFATAVFVLLTPDSGEIVYVNAGHNPPMIYSSGSARFLEATGLPLGLFGSAAYEARAAAICSSDLLLVFTDGLPDSISGESPERLVQSVLTGDIRTSLANLKHLVDPRLNQDDITILMVKRALAQPGDDTHILTTLDE